MVLTEADIVAAFRIHEHVEQSVFCRRDLVRDLLGTLRFDTTSEQREAVRRRIVDAAIEDWQTPAGVRRFDTIDTWPG